MEINLFELLYAIGELLTMTWPGRCVLGIVVVAAVSKLTK